MKRNPIPWLVICWLTFAGGRVIGSDNPPLCTPEDAVKVLVVPPKIVISPEVIPVDPPSEGEPYTMIANVKVVPGVYAIFREAKCGGNIPPDPPPPCLQSIHWEVHQGAPGPSGDCTPNNCASYNCTVDFTPSQSGTIEFTASATGIGACSTNVYIPFHLALPSPLGHWRFNGTWNGEEGQVPYVESGVTHSPGWDDLGLRVSSTGEVLGYHAFESDGKPNFSRNRGSIRFWFKPEWDDLFAGGKLLDSWWNSVPGRSLSVTKTSFNWCSIVSSPYSWTTGQWYQIVVTYSSSASEVYVNGQSKASGPGVGSMAWLSAFTVGNGADGLSPAMGVIDELETFNYVLGPTTISSDYADAVDLDSDNDGSLDLDELRNGTDPHNPDTDGDGKLDGSDPFPLDPNRWDPDDPNDTTFPVIELLEPITASPTT